MKKTERRAQLLAHAEKVFSKRGYHAAKIEDIVEAAGVARGTFYLYFVDKRTIFEELVERFLRRFHLAIQPIDLSDRARSVSLQVKQNIERILLVFFQDAAMTKILLTDAPGLDVAFDRKLQTVYEEVHQLLVESLADGQQVGLVASGDATVYSFLGVGALKEVLAQGVRREWALDQVPRLTHQIFQFLSAGFLRTDEPQIAASIAGMRGGKKAG